MDLMELLPDYYSGNLTMQELQTLLTEEILKLSDGFKQTIDQCFVSTASSVLGRYEKMHGIKTDVSKSEETRRGKIKAKLAGTGTFTKSMLINSVRAFPGGNAEIVEDNPNAQFTIKFNDYYRVPDVAAINEIYSITDELKPAHLAYDHTFTYDWWNNMNNTITWEEATTWDSLRSYEEA